MPPCPSCGGVLKPDVVFFGDGIPAQRAQRSLELARSCSALLVVGSSLAVWSAFRLAKVAVEGGARLGILTAGGEPWGAAGLVLWGLSFFVPKPWQLTIVVRAAPGWLAGLPWQAHPRRCTCRAAFCRAGHTRADQLAHLKFEARAGETLARLAAHPALLVPPQPR